MSGRISEYINNKQTTIEEQIKLILNEQKEQIPKNLYDSMAYSLLAGGKRLRPVLLLASYHSFQDDSEKVYRTAVALEMIHTYSLIHDDLPAMDDDDYRRGKLTNHKKFNEATAILAGDALLTIAFELITTDSLLTDEEKVYLTNQLAIASGPSGMVAGQVLDMEGENQTLTLEQLEEIHRLKTGKLIDFAIIAGAYLGKATKEQQTYLAEFSHYLGLIFQVQDDILDVVGDPHKLGKPVGSDSDNEKSTYPQLLGLEGAYKQKALYEQKALQALKDAEIHRSYLANLLTFFSERDH